VCVFDRRRSGPKERGKPEGQEVRGQLNVIYRSRRPKTIGGMQIRPIGREKRGIWIGRHSKGRWRPGGSHNRCETKAITQLWGQLPREERSEERNKSLKLSTELRRVRNTRASTPVKPGWGEFLKRRKKKKRNAASGLVRRLEGISFRS